MSARDSQGRVEWRHPVAIALLNQYKNRKSIGEIIESESSKFLSRMGTSDTLGARAYSIPTPIERIAASLNIKITSGHGSSFLATTKQLGSEFEVSRGDQHYFRFRFTLAHEIGHIVLRDLAGPLSFEELAATKDTNREEETLCDFFASVLLIPSPALGPYLSNAPAVNAKLINEIARDFKVGRSVVLKRIAALRDGVLLFWDEIRNPRNPESPKVERIKQVHKPVSEAFNCYIPLFCTPNDIRFDPNLILESFSNRVSLSGKVKISDLGSLPTDIYEVHNIFFQVWTDELLNTGIVDKRQNFFNMATLIQR